MKKVNWKTIINFLITVLTAVAVSYTHLVKELVRQNKAVKIDNLAIFSIGIINKMGAASIKEWNLAKFVEGYRLRARACLLYTSILRATTRTRQSRKRMASIMRDQ